MTDDDSKQEPKDPRVKDLVTRDRSQPLEQFVDEETAAQLAKWFGLPSFAEVEAGEAELAARQEDPEVLAVRERRRRILEQDIDKELLAAIERRYTLPDDIFKFVPDIEPFDPNMALFDGTRYIIPEGQEPPEERTYDQPEDITEALHENTPQALLRDLHRPETDFDQPADEWTQEEEQEPPPPLITDIAARTREAIGFRFQFEPFVQIDAGKLMDESRSEIRAKWTDILDRARLVNRRVSE